MRLRRGTVAVVAAAALVWSLAAPAQAVVAASAAPNIYLTPVVVVPRGGHLTFVNGDIEAHNLVALEAFRSDGGAPWCVAYKFSGVPCPLFWSDTISIGATEVLGVADAEPGTYRFFCEPHPWMVGELIIL